MLVFGGVDAGVGPAWFRTVSCVAVSARVRVMVDDCERVPAEGRNADGSGAVTVLDKLGLLAVAATLGAGGVAAASCDCCELLFAGAGAASGAGSRAALALVPWAVA